MGIRCEHIAVFYMPLGTPLEPPGPSGHQVSTISLLRIGGQPAFNLACWNSCYVMKAMTLTKDW